MTWTQFKGQTHGGLDTAGFVNASIGLKFRYGAIKEHTQKAVIWPILDSRRLFDKFFVILLDCLLNAVKMLIGVLEFSWSVVFLQCLGELFPIQQGTLTINPSK